MPVASVQSLGGHLGLFELTTPSGRKVSISPEMEERIALEALQWKLHQKLTADERLKATAIDSGIGAVGSAVGLAAGGLFLGLLLGRGKSPI